MYRNQIDFTCLKKSKLISCSQSFIKFLNRPPVLPGLGIQARYAEIILFSIKYAMDESMYYTNTHTESKQLDISTPHGRLV